MRPALWTIVAAAAASISLALGMRQTFGLFLLPLSAEAGISPAVLGTAVAIHNLVWGLSQPISGAIADRHGAGRVMAGGALLLAAGVGLPALWTSAPAILIGIGLLTGIGVSCCGTGAALAAVGRAVPPARRGEMIGLASAGGSLGQAAMVPLAQSLIGGVGAIATLGILALTLLVIVPISRGIEWGAPEQVPGRAATGLAGLPALARQALADRDFALLTAGFFACGFQLAFLTMHLPSHIALCGLPTGLGAMALMTIGLFNIPGSWLCGKVSNHLQPELALGAIYALRTVAIACYAFTTPTYAGTLVFAAVMGFVWLGTIPLTSAAIARRFGVADLGALYGVCFLSHQVGGFLGAAAGAVLLETAGSYEAFWPVMVAVGIAASVMNWIVRPPRVAMA
ncbi:MFS transporter [Paracraurococcus lichenis]|uniref:MFS transporter n=1 Tax=Paracraurococcus lichenis TaxID=3064888 RepID=A0ABT9DSX9_9PROT|nr:MFS transporter [Paracraurococcus sp. LOR1-02]MDO9706997.1 MFS transporter [Paracraurococcus sp. LOR1-02]